jgi:hypothetical protein
MKTPTKINTLSFMGLLVVALSSIAIAGPNGPPNPPDPNGPGPRPPGEKLSINVENVCTVNIVDNPDCATPPYPGDETCIASGGGVIDAFIGADLEIDTSVTESGSEFGDGTGQLGKVRAQAAFKFASCSSNPAGNQETCTMEFKPAGYPDDIADPTAMVFDVALGKWEASIDLCATKDDETIFEGTAVNAFVYVDVDVANPNCAAPPYPGDETCTDSGGGVIDAFIVQATWESRCDDIDGPYELVVVDGESVYMDVVDESDVRVPENIVCPALQP